MRFIDNTSAISAETPLPLRVALHLQGDGVSIAVAEKRDRWIVTLHEAGPEGYLSRYVWETESRERGGQIARYLERCCAPAGTSLQVHALIPEALRSLSMTGVPVPRELIP